MALVFGGQSTRGLLYLHARIPPHMVIRGATIVHLPFYGPESDIIE